jgi:hypothetical protein
VGTPSHPLHSILHICMYFNLPEEVLICALVFMLYLREKILSNQQT